MEESYNRAKDSLRKALEEFREVRKTPKNARKYSSLYGYYGRAHAHAIAAMYMCVKDRHKYEQLWSRITAVIAMIREQIVVDLYDPTTRHTSTRRQMAIVRRVKGYDNSQWESLCRDRKQRALKAKELKKLQLENEGAIS